MDLHGIVGNEDDVDCSKKKRFCCCGFLSIRCRCRLFGRHGLEGHHVAAAVVADLVMLVLFNVIVFIVCGL